MRTTLNIDDDVFSTAKSIAAQQRKPVGEVISALLRKALKPSGSAPAIRNGFPLFPVNANSRPVTPEIIEELLMEDEF